MPITGEGRFSRRAGGAGGSAPPVVPRTPREPGPSSFETDVRGLPGAPAEKPPAG
jgi:hypothetical protein